MMTHPDDEWNEAAPYSWPDDPDSESERERGRCPHCRCYGIESPFAPGEFYCTCCGKEWNINEMPEVP